MQFADFDTRKPTPEMLYDARRDARMSIDQAAQFCGLHRTSYARQESGQSRVSAACYRLLAMMGGWLPGTAFEGWHIDRDFDKLWSPEDVYFTPGEIRSIPYLYATIRDYEIELRGRHSPVLIGPNVIPFRRSNHDE